MLRIIGSLLNTNAAYEVIETLLAFSERQLCGLIGTREENFKGLAWSCELQTFIVGYHVSYMYYQATFQKIAST